MKSRRTKSVRKQMTTAAVNLPIIDLSSSDSISSANSIRQACIECGFFYLVNHGVEEELFAELFDPSSNFFSLPLEDKLKLSRKHNRGYTALFSENLDFASSSKGDSKESFYVGPLDDPTQSNLNQWPPEDILPSWRPAVESYYRKVMSAGKRLISLVALALNLDEDFFEKVGAMDKPSGFLRLLHYPGELGSTDEEIYGASAHSDYGMITLLASNGVPGLQVCRDKSKQPRIWEDVLHIDGAFIVNIGDMMERWTNCLFRSTLHRVMPTGQERYSVIICLLVHFYLLFIILTVLHNEMVAFFMDPNDDCVVECLKSCCSEASPPRFPPVRSGDYLEERFRLTYAT